MLRDTCSFRQQGHHTAIQGWLGHRSITCTAVYTALAPNRFRDFGEIELSAHHYPVHDCPQQVVIVMSHGRMHESIHLASRHTRLVHGRSDLADDPDRVRIFAD
jgi:hypothetical protein